MPTGRKRYVAFLRGINLGRRRLAMSRLKALFEELRFDAVETFIASGNVLFSSRVADAGSLETRIARHLEASLGYEVDTFVRTTDELAAIERAGLFDDGAADGRVHVGLFQQALPAEVARKFAAVRTEVDEFRVVGREFFWRCRVRTSDSKVWTLPEFKALKLPTSTLRNMNTIRKLVARCGRSLGPGG